MYSKHILIGNLGTDVDHRFTPGGQAVSFWRMAVNRRWTDAQGQTHDEATWYRVSCWGKLAETCAQYLSKGSLVLVEGDRMEIDAYKNKQGEPAASMELTAQTVKFLSRREDRANGGGGYSGKSSATPAYDGPGLLSEDEMPF